MNCFGRNSMKCPYCGEEMVKGAIISSRGSSFISENVDYKIIRFRKKSDIDLSDNEEAYRCPKCKIIIINK